jgi:hypothetical protein
MIQLAIHGKDYRIHIVVYIQDISATLSSVLSRTYVNDWDTQIFTLTNTARGVSDQATRTLQ